MVPIINMEKTGQNIVALRKQAGLSVKDIQDALGLGTLQAVYKWQQGHALPSLDNLVILASLFHVTMDDIVVVENKAYLDVCA